MMKLAVISATGKAGTAIALEGLNCGLEVTGFVRNKEKAADLIKAGVKIEVKDIMSLTYEDLSPFDAIVDAFGVFEEDQLHLYAESAHHLVDILSSQPNRLLVVGGTASLYADESRQSRLLDSPGFPAAFKPVASAVAAVADILKQSENVNWTFVSPAADFRPSGPRTGRYKLGGEVLPLSSTGESQVSYADYAVAILDEVIQGGHNKQKISVVAE